MLLGDVDSAIGTIGSIGAAETEFARTHPNSGYTCDISKLGANQVISGLIKHQNTRNGYEFEVIGCRGGDQRVANSAYLLTARPSHAGQPAFCSDETRIMWWDETGSPAKCMEMRRPLND